MDRLPPNGDFDRGWIFGLLERESASLYARALALTRDRNDAADLTQQTFLLALQMAARIDPERNPRGWLRAVMANVWRKAVDERSRVPDPMRLDTPESLDPAGAAVRSEAQVLVRDAVSRLPNSHRSVVEAFLVDGETPTDIARRLRRNPSTVRTQLQRGLSMVRRHLGPAGLCALLAMQARASHGTGAPVAARPRAWRQPVLAASGVVVLVAAVAMSRGDALDSGAPSTEAIPADSLEQVARPAPLKAASRTPIASSAAPIETVPAPTLSARLRWRDGSPCVDLPVRLVAVDEAGARLGSGLEFVERRSDEHGVVRFDRRAGDNFQLLYGSAAQRSAVLRWPTVPAPFDVEATVEMYSIQRGCVVDAEGQPVPGAIVYGAAETAAHEPPFALARTDAEGHFTVSVLEGPCSLWAAISPRLRSTIHLATGDNDDVMLRLQRFTGVVAGTVIGLDERPAAGVEVCVQQLGFSFQWFTTDAGGRFEVPALVDRPTAVVARTHDPRAVVLRRAQGGQRVVADLRLERTATVRGVAPAGLPPGTVVRCLPQLRRAWDALRILECRSAIGPDRSFEVTGLRPGRATVGLWDPLRGAWISERRVTVRAGETLALNLDKPLAGMRVVGRVLNHAGEPCHDYIVRLNKHVGAGESNEPGSWRAARTTTDSTGGFSFDGVEHRSYRLIVREPLTATVVRAKRRLLVPEYVPSDEPVILRLPPPHPGGLRGRLRCSPGVAAPTQVEVCSVARKGRRWRETHWLGRDLEFEFNGLPAGTWEIWVPSASEPLHTVEIGAEVIEVEVELNG